MNKIYPEIEKLEAVELMLILQIIPFMFIVARHKGAQHGLKGHVVLVPSDLTKIQNVLPRSCNEEHLISLALKRRLSDKSAFSKQHIRPAAVNGALAKFMEINPFYQNVSICKSWEKISKTSDPELWTMLTDDTNVDLINDNTEATIPRNSYSNEHDSLDSMSNSEHSDEPDSSDSMSNHEHSVNSSNKIGTEKRTIQDKQIPYPTALHNTDVPAIGVEQILNIAPGDGQIPVSVFTEPNWEARAFVKQFSEGTFNLTLKEIPELPHRNISMLV